MKTRSYRKLAAMVAFVSMTFAGMSFATAQVAAPLGELSWGDSHEDVLEHHEDLLMARFRVERSEVRDTLRIDQMRRAMNDRLESWEDSWELFDEQRTGYETSLLATEVRRAPSWGMLTIRDGGDTRYYLFKNDQLAKLIVPTDIAALGWIGFDEFVERQEAAFGATDDRVDTVDDLGIPTMVRALWNGEDTNIRAENRSHIYQSYLLVYTDSNVEDELFEPGRSSTAAATDGGVEDLMRQLEAQSAGSSPNVVDDILGQQTTVQTRLRDDAEEGETTEMGGSTGAMDDSDEDLEDVEQQRRQPATRQAPAQQQSAPAEEAPAGGGVTIY